MLPPDTEQAFRRLVGAVAGPDALPAGGAAGVTAIAMGVALGAKVIRLSANTASGLQETGARLERALERLMPEFSADCVAFADVLEAFRRPRDDADRKDVIRAAWRAATEAPVTVALVAAEAEALLLRCSGQVNTSVAGDLKAALELVRAGRRIAESNARENARHLEPELARQVLARLDSMGDR